VVKGWLVVPLRFEGTEDFLCRVMVGGGGFRGGLPQGGKYGVYYPSASFEVRNTKATHKLK